MAKVMTKKVEAYRVDTEEEATEMVEWYKNEAANKGFTITKTKVDYKTKKDRKTGEIMEEWWIVEITISYDN